jgi:hypothetical protein
MRVWPLAGMATVMRPWTLSSHTRPAWKARKDGQPRSLPLDLNLDHALTRDLQSAAVSENESKNKSKIKITIKSESTSLSIRANSPGLKG